MKIQAAAMEAALEDFRGLQYSTRITSLYESFLVAKWLTANQRYPDPNINDVNEAVAEIFEVFPNHNLGRIYPFRYDWKNPEGSGRKTVWNQTTRGDKLATTIFKNGDIRGGLNDDAASTMARSLHNRPLPSRQSLACLLLRNYSFSKEDSWVEAEEQLRSKLSLTESELSLITSDSQLGMPITGQDEWDTLDLPNHLVPPDQIEMPVGTSNMIDEFDSEIAVVLDNRVERMLRLAIAANLGILLVGPPGTGKSKILQWITQNIANNPSYFGFRQDLNPHPMWRTPDEGWSAFDLIGGLAPDASGKLKWAHGFILQAIKEDRWIILDETNRADMDKIMGPLLTWLSEQEVEVGYTEPHGGVPITLGWNDSEACLADDPFQTGEPTRFLAGKDWRLLGTYNPQDAQRVFRFGLALSRRFVVIPIPALKPGQFEKLLESAIPKMSDYSTAAITGLYSAHHSKSETTLGPAIFLRMANYIGQASSNDSMDEIIAEAYTINIGKYLASYDDHTFKELGFRVTHDETVLSNAQWSWIESRRVELG